MRFFGFLIGVVVNKCNIILTDTYGPSQTFSNTRLSEQM